LDSWAENLKEGLIDFQWTYLSSGNPPIALDPYEDS
jgi:hypothetical protein